MTTTERLLKEFQATIKPADKRRTAGKLYLPKAWTAKR